MVYMYDNNKSPSPLPPADLVLDADKYDMSSRAPEHSETKQKDSETKQN
jgi:hypothetical protein